MNQTESFAKTELIRANLHSVIHAGKQVVELLLNAVLASGHVLLDDVPGVGKTTLAKALARSLEADFKRIQFTSDMMPSDILGSSVFSQKTGEFIFYKGPIFANILLADEINRASPRTQSALLEAMNESQISIEGGHYDLPHPFLVIATENPIEYFGTFPLPEAQLDRFMVRFSIGYPNEEQELAMLNERWDSDPLEKLKPVISCAELQDLQKEVRTVSVERSVQEYMRAIVSATREAESGFVLGASPRALLDLAHCAQARAFLQKRDYVIPDDVVFLMPFVLAHRLQVSSESKHAGQTAATLLDAIRKKIRVPV